MANEQTKCKFCEKQLTEEEISTGKGVCKDCVDMCIDQQTHVSKIINRRSVSVDFYKNSVYNDLQFIEVTEWSNGEGFDILTSWKGRDDRHIELTFDELEGIANALYRLGFRPMIYDKVNPIEEEIGNEND